jgi:fatty acid desaturase
MADDIYAIPVAVGPARGRTLRSMNEYAREVRAHLPPAIFRREPIRLLWLAFHGGVIIMLAALVIRTAPPWCVALLCGLVIGHSWDCLGFLAHETLHHAVVKSGAVEQFVGYIAFLP